MLLRERDETGAQLADASKNVAKPPQKKKIDRL